MRQLNPRPAVGVVYSQHKPKARAEATEESVEATNEELVDFLDEVCLNSWAFDEGAQADLTSYKKEFSRAQNLFHLSIQDFVDMQLGVLAARLRLKTSEAKIVFEQIDAWNHRQKLSNQRVTLVAACSASVDRANLARKR